MFYLQYFTVRVNPDQMMTFSETADPCALLEVYCIGRISAENNARYSKGLRDLICSKLGIDQKRYDDIFH